MCSKHHHHHHHPFGFGHRPWHGRREEAFPWGGPPFGGRHGHHGRGKFGRGDLKYVILDLIAEQPRHGYDIIRALEERFHGLYSPSPGSVYPTLQLLEDQGYAVASEQDGKRVYAITDAGRAFLAEHKSTVDEIRSKMAGRFGPGSPELRDLIAEVRQLGQFLFRQGAAGALKDPETVRRLREAVAHARTEIEAIFAAEPTTHV